MATFWPHTAGLHQAIVSIYWVELFVPPWLLVIGVSTSWLLGFDPKHCWHYQRKLLIPSWLSCCPTVGIHASGISIPPSLLMLSGWSLMWIASLTLRVPVRVSVNKLNFTSHLLKFVSLCNDLRNNLLSNHADDTWLTIVIIALHYHCYDLFVCLFFKVKAFAIL